MPSPFPGMDPYIEDPEIWSDFHNNLATEFQAQLNPLIRPRYIARLIPRVTYEIIEIGKVRGVRPDVGIWQRPLPQDRAGSTAIAIPPAPVESLVSLDLPLRLTSVEIRTTDSLELVTAIEILSPVNKRVGHDAFYEYRRKRRELLRSTAHLLEVDLLRGDERPPLEHVVPEAPYYVVLSREQRRPLVDVWPIQLNEKLPLLPIPLLEPDPDVPFDLHTAVTNVYDRAGYADLINYRRSPPPPPLNVSEATWLDEQLRKQGLRD